MILLKNKRATARAFFAVFIFSCSVMEAQDLTQLNYADLDSLTHIEYNNRNYEKVILYTQAGREKAKAEFGEQDSVYAKYTGDLGFFYHDISDYKKAEKLYLEAKKIRAEVLGDMHTEYAVILNNLGTLYHDLGSYTKVEPLYIEANNIKAKVLGKENPEYAKGLDNLAGLYQDMGYYDQAELLYLEAKNIKASVLGKEDLTYARSLNNLASLYYQIGNYAQAELLLIEAMNIFTKKEAKGDPSYATSLDNLSSLYFEKGSYAQAEPLLLEALEIYDEILGKEHSKYAVGLQKLAVLYDAMGNYKQAEKLHLQAKNIVAIVLGKGHHLYANSLNYLAGLYQDNSNYIRAESFLLQANNIYFEILGREHPLYAIGLSNLAYLYLDMGRLDSAFHYSMASIAANSAKIGNSFPEVGSLDQFDYYSDLYINGSIRNLLNIIKAQYETSGDQGKLHQQYQLAQSAMRLNERIRNNFSNEEDKLRALRTNSEMVSRGIETALLLKDDHYKQEAYSFAELNKSILLADAVKGNRARAFGDLPDSLAEKEILLQNKLAELKKEQYSAQSAEQKDRINQSLGELNFEIDAFLKSLKDRYPQYHALKYENITAAAEDIQALLDEKTLLIEYFQADSILYLFALSQNKVELYPLKLSKPVLKEKIQRLRRALSDYELIKDEKETAYRLYTESAHWFYKNLLETAIKDEKPEHLIVVADGELGHLPFEAFLVEAAPRGKTGYNNLHYLVNDLKISYNYSATLWKESLNMKKRKNAAGMLACAASYPEPNKIDSSLLAVRQPYFFRLRSPLLPLPGAQKGIAVLRESFQGDFLWAEAANEKYFKENAQNYGIIHLAMHGLLDTIKPMMSSLAFTENKDSTEDNFLQAYEISRLKLNAALVVLSACETGYGAFKQGQGIISLARSFMYAGVPSLVVSLWKVEDVSTAAIMKSFYDNLADGMDKADALRQAKLNYIYSAFGMRAHPAFWSPFIQLGDSRSIELTSKKNWLRWLGGGMLGLLLTGILFFWKNTKR